MTSVVDVRVKAAADSVCPAFNAIAWPFIDNEPVELTLPLPCESPVDAVKATVAPETTWPLFSAIEPYSPDASNVNAPVAFADPVTSIGPLAAAPIVAPVNVPAAPMVSPPPPAIKVNNEVAPILDAAIIVSLDSETFAPVTFPVVCKLPVLTTVNPAVAANEPKARIVLPVLSSVKVPAEPVSEEIPTTEPAA